MLADLAFASADSACARTALALAAAATALALPNVMIILLIFSKSFPRIPCPSLLRLHSISLRNIRYLQTLGFDRSQRFHFEKSLCWAFFCCCHRWVDASQEKLPPFIASKFKLFLFPYLGIFPANLDSHDY